MNYSVMEETTDYSPGLATFRLLAVKESRVAGRMQISYPDPRGREGEVYLDSLTFPRGYREEVADALFLKLSQNGVRSFLPMGKPSKDTQYAISAFSFPMLRPSVRDALNAGFRLLQEKGDPQELMAQEDLLLRQDSFFTNRILPSKLRCASLPVLRQAKEELHALAFPKCLRENPELVVFSGESLKMLRKLCRSHEKSIDQKIELASRDQQRQGSWER